MSEHAGAEMPPSRSREVRAGPDIGLAPGDLGTLQAFVNTLDIEQGTDALGSPTDLDAWLARAGLASNADSPSSQRELDMALELREALRGVLRSHVPLRNSPRQPGSTAGTNSSDAHDARPDVTGDSAVTRVADVAAAM